MYTPEFRRHFVKFVPGDTLMRLRLATKCWRAAADAFIDEGVKSSTMIVHDGKDKDWFNNSDGRKAKMRALATRVIFLLNITKVGDRACVHAYELCVVDIPEGIKSIGKQAFWGCPSLTTVFPPTTLISIGEAVFEYCSSLENIHLLHTNLQKIGQYAFNYCPELKSMTIPDSLQTLGEHVFHECFKPVPSNIDVQEYDSDDEEITDATSEVVAHLRFQQLLSGNNFLNTDDFRRLLVKFLQNDTLMSIRLASKPWSRVADAFISDGVESGAMIVRGEENLRGSHDDLKESHQLATSAIFLLNIKKVCDLVCCDAINLVVVDNPEGVESISRMVFGYCSSLTTVSFPRTLTPIGDLAFSGCSSLVNVDFRHTSVKELGDFAFTKCSELKSMKIPDSLQTLGRNAFRGCTKLVPSNFNWNTYDNDAVVAHLRSLQKN